MIVWCFSGVTCLLYSEVFILCFMGGQIALFLNKISRGISRNTRFLEQEKVFRSSGIFLGHLEVGPCRTEVTGGSNLYDDSCQALQPR
ncbi:hypothetical protein BDV27DRAFT_30894 [Aspergillus caelatus]|uniref:Uncharacterized protein n=1 Tax=Aspergillus caelatus TaxID=61420 RepID=A0A5N6ZUM4_9EURO|nr:uncharacterized protein BDV27DRAFT_30894 [Aspergillus caelatus]KAE8361222.1 hypothetical protein BDV27DRAFT_30894 [Aspergillus caelatus]